MLVLATIKVRNFNVFEQFEKAVAPLLLEVGAKMLYAVEVQRHEDGSGEEIHLLEFPNSESLEEYKEKTNVDWIMDLRNQAISSMEIKMGVQIKKYSSSTIY